jgi:hypothetical protein
MDNMIDPDALIDLSPDQRRALMQALVALEQESTPPPAASWRWYAVIAATTAACVFMVVWIAVLALTLPAFYHTGNWRGAWVGFDIAELAMFAATGWAAWRRRQILIICLIVLATLLLCDAWFDVALDVRTSGFVASLLSALLVEVPLAVLAILLARRLLHMVIGQVMRYEGPDRQGSAALAGSAARPGHARSARQADAAAAAAAPVAAHDPGARGTRLSYWLSSCARAVAMPGCSNWKPAAASRAGITRWLPSSSPATSPSAARRAGVGSASSAGRCSAAPSARVKSALVTGSGAVRLYGPSVLAFSSRNLIARTSSARLIQLKYCRPDPTLAPRPSRNGGSSRASMPPSRASTTPERVWVTLIPASRAGSAAASQSRTRSARNPAPCGAVSSVTRSAVSP